MSAGFRVPIDRRTVELGCGLQLVVDIDEKGCAFPGTYVIETGLRGRKRLEFAVVEGATVESLVAELDKALAEVTSPVWYGVDPAHPRQLPQPGRAAAELAVHGLKPSRTYTDELAAWLGVGLTDRRLEPEGPPLIASSAPRGLRAVLAVDAKGSTG